MTSALHKKYSNYHYCIVRDCKNTSVKTPGKLWIRVPSELNMRNAWLKLARKDPNSLSTETNQYLCEDHFDLPSDMENYLEFKLMGNIKQIRMRNGCVPTRFDCQPAQYKNINDKIHTKCKKAPETVTSYQEIDNSENEKRTASQTRAKVLPLQPTEQDKQSTKRKRQSIGLPQTDPSSLASFILNEPTLEQCRCCAEIVQDCIDVTVVDRPYLDNDLIVLALNGLRAELDFKNALPKTICLACDEKIQEIYKFIKQVKAGQEALIDENDEIVEKPSVNEIVIAEVKSEIYDDESTRSADEFFDTTEMIENDIKPGNDFIKIENKNIFDDHNYVAEAFTHKRKYSEVENTTKKIKELKDLVIQDLIGDVKEAVTNEADESSRYKIVRVQQQKKPKVYINQKNGQIVLIKDINDEVIKYDVKTNTYYSSSSKVR